jgi:hypothetical protein
MRESSDRLGIGVSNSAYHKTHYEPQEVDTTIINILIPEAFVGLLPIEPGELLVLCVGADDCPVSYFDVF